MVRRRRKLVPHLGIFKLWIWSFASSNGLLTLSSNQSAGHGNPEAHSLRSTYKRTLKMVRVLLFLTALLVAVGSHASDTFLIESELTHGGELLGSPAIAVDASIPATISVTDSYELIFVATPQKSGAILVATDITIAGRNDSPSILVHLDELASISIGDMTLDLTVSRFTPK